MQKASNVGRCLSRRPDEMPFRVITQGSTIKDVNVGEFFDRPRKQRKDDMFALDSIYILLS